ncbi:MAG TPA: glyoxalase superfamily protein [Kofleriaceae bacterium]|jgi:catechol 2,3-dioxygenase-like lactoylglutathione lyase family enzyme
MAGWYTRPVLFTDDLTRSLAFYQSALGFAKDWHEGDGTGTVCQISRDGCEVILCEDKTRRDRGRLFVSLDADGIAALRGALAANAIAHEQSWWGSDVIVIADPDGNQLMVSYP